MAPQRRTLIIGIAAIALVLGSETAHAQGKWRVGAPIPEGANEVLGAAIDGQVLVYGGQDPTSKPQGIF